MSGGAGTAKTSLAAHFMDAACARGERALCFQFEESPAQYIRNMRSIGIDLDRWMKKGLLSSTRPVRRCMGSSFIWPRCIETSTR